MFCDFSIVYQPDVTAMAKMLERAKAAGYDVVAINHIVTEKLTLKHVNPVPKLLEEIAKLKTKQTVSFQVSDPLADVCITEKEENTLSPTLGAGGIISRGWSGTGGLKVLSRLTLKLKDVSMGQCINSCPAATRQYDIVAVQPVNEQTLQQALSNLDIDLVSYDLTKTVDKSFKHHTVQPAKERGIYFEIPYVPAIQDQMSRRQLFFNGNNLIRALHGTNLIFTSQASFVLDIRGPYDVANLGHLFEINQSMAKKMLTSNPLSLLKKSETRKYTEKAIVAVAEDIGNGNSLQEVTGKTAGRSAEEPPTQTNSVKKAKKQA